MKKITKDPKTGRIRVQTVNDKPSMTKQSYADQVDINQIVKKYLNTGILPISKKTGVYADLTEVKDFQGAMNTVLRAQKAMDGLPADIRAKFDNDPQKLLNFINDPKTLEQQYELGLREKPKTTPTPKSASNAEKGEGDQSQKA